MNVVDQHATEIKRETTTKKPTMKASHKVMTTINHRVFVCVCLASFAWQFLSATLVKPMNQGYSGVFCNAANNP